MASRKRTLKRLREVGITILVLIVIAFVAEWVCRGFQDKLLDPKDRPMLAFDPMVNHTFKPYLSLDFESPTGERVVVDINSDGLRARSLIPKGGGETRIVGLGDALTAVTHLPVSDSYLAQLESALQARASADRTFGVINAAIDGYNLQQSRDLLVKLGERMDPDVVILGFNVKDDIRDYGREVGLALPGKRFLRQKSYLYHVIQHGYHKIKDREKTDAERPDPADLAAWREVLARYGQRPEDEEIVRIVERANREVPLYRAGGIAAGQWSGTEMMLREIRDCSRALGAPLTLVLIPTRRQVLDSEWEKTIELLALREADVDPSRPQKELTRIAAGLELPVIDLLPAFREHPSPDSLYFPASRHWTAEGHLVAAEAIDEFLSGEGFLGRQ